MSKQPFQLVDLTHSLHPGVPTWSGHCGFQMEVRMDYAPHGLRVQTMKGHCGLGTHVDAPAHFIPGGVSIDKIPLSSLVGPAVVLDLSLKRSSHLQVTVEDLRLYEKMFGSIPPKAFVVARTGWEEFWRAPDQYRNEDEFGCKQFPTFSKEAALYLAGLPILGIGIDTLSPDGEKSGFPVHHAILGAGQIILENLANLAKMPPSGSYIAAIPIPYEGGCEAPARVIGVIL